MNVWVRPMAKEGITIDPPRFATRLTICASNSAGSPSGCSRSPYVDSQISTSALDGGVAGSFKIAWLYRPISPEKTTTVFLPPSVIVRYKLEDPAEHHGALDVAQ